MKKLLLSAALATSMLFTASVDAQQEKTTDDTFVCYEYGDIQAMFDIFTMSNKKRQNHYFSNVVNEYQDDCFMYSDGFEYYVVNASFLPFIKIEVWVDGEPEIVWAIDDLAHESYTINFDEWFE